ncbi:pyridoxal-phosphate dependent enzyme [Undibacterium sp. CY18W]|uniref:Pyridoxal-phosphate dependent enzyme n=1 Tax=Undibacterium hunanense TaxID=2762292 RepID=A0ABR6ZMM8_9BURK|nr:pyridoxal-phosphate dependent enzyme [Undibacterium hunanense]MBC3916665.1 pyridoxal-phosphate dependent enzyme [Undibacterium hunanense]
MLPPNQVSPCQRVESRHFPGMDLWIKRDDLLHPQVSGNKFRKLKYPLQAVQGRAVHIVSMGGIWSNHLHALAHACALAGMSGMPGMTATALVRGAEGMQSAMLDDIRELGMQVKFVTREAYRQLRSEPDAWRQYLVPDGREALWLPEGGSSALALRGVAELVAELPFIPTHTILACGTGATLAGVLAGLAGRSQVMGVAAISNAGYLKDEIARLLAEAAYPDYKNYQLLTDSHLGGYARVTPELMAFCADFEKETGIPLEPVYTGKMLFALRQLWHDGYLAADASVLAIHTGGLQGRRGFAPMPA